MKRRAFAFRCLAGAALLSSAIAWSCGLDTLGVRPEPDAAIDGEVDAFLPPKGDANTDVQKDGPLGCPSTNGSIMVRFVAEAGTACIDSTEVTNAQYDVFLNADA